MSGFETIDTPAVDITPAAAQQPVQDLMGLLDPENTPQEILAGETPGTELEPEQLGESAESAPVQEQPPVEDSEQGEAVETYTLKVNGEERHVTLNDLKEGFQLKSDYTRKTQDLAEREQQLGLQAQGVSEQQNQYSELVDAMKQRLDTLIPPEPNWAALAQSDPIEHTRQRAAWDQLQGQVKAVESEQKRLTDDRQKQFQEGYQGYVQDQQRKLVQALPQLADQSKAREFFTNLNQYASNEYGFTQQEVASIGDHRFYLMAEKARQYDLLQAGAKGKVVPTPHVPTLKPGARQTAEPVALKSFRKASERLERTGSTRDAAAAIEALM